MFLLYLRNFNKALLMEYQQSIDDLQDIYELISNAIEEEPPITIREGGIIKEGFDDFLPKPVESSVLQRALKRHIPIKKQKAKEDAKAARKSGKSLRG